MTKQEKALYMRGYNAALRSLGVCNWCRNKHSNGTIMCQKCMKETNQRRRAKR